MKASRALLMTVLLGFPAAVLGGPIATFAFDGAWVGDTIVDDPGLAALFGGVPVDGDPISGQVTWNLGAAGVSLFQDGFAGLYQIGSSDSSLSMTSRGVTVSGSNLANRVLINDNIGGVLGDRWGISDQLAGSDLFFLFSFFDPDEVAITSTDFFMLADRGAYELSVFSIFRQTDSGSQFLGSALATETTAISVPEPGTLAVIVALLLASARRHGRGSGARILQR